MMKSENGISLIRWRKQHALKPIETKRICEGKVDENSINGNGRREGEPLSPAARMFHEPTFNVYIVAIMGCKTRIQPEVVKANLAHTLLKHPRFSSLQVGDDDMKWVPTNVNLEKHVIVPELDPNMDSPDKFVEEYVYSLSKTGIDKSQPLWDLHLLNVKTSESEAVGIFRIHHSLGDGTSLMSLLLACTRQISDPEALPTIPLKRRQQNTDYSRGFKGVHVVLAFWSVFQLFWNTVVDAIIFIATAMFLRDRTDNLIKLSPGLEFTPRRIIHRTVSLNDLKFVKNEMNSTINDVALAITQAGLSRYLCRRYREITKKDEEQTEMTINNLPKNIRLRSTLLINLRPAAGIQVFADMMEKDTEAKWGNWIGYVLLPLTIAIRDDPLDYIREAKALVDRKKHSLEAIFTFSISELFLKLFGIKVASALSHKIISNTTMCFSNIVGPLEEIGYYGHPMSYLAASCYGQPQALMINFQSYVNKMTIVLSVDEDAIPNPHQLCDDIVESLRIIKDAVSARNNKI